MDHVGVGEAAHDLGDRVRLADVCEELVAEPFALARAANDAGDVDEANGGGEDPLAAEDLGELVEPGIGKVDDANVRLDRRERVVRCESVIVRKRVEEGRLADIRESDDTNS